MFRSLQRALLFMVGFSLPLQGFSLLHYAFGLTPFKLATALLLVAAAMHFAVVRSRMPRDPKRGLIIVFGVSYGLACVMGIVQGSSLTEIAILASTQYSILLYYLLLGYVVRKRDDLVLVLWALLLGGAVTAAPAALGMQQGQEGLGYGERYGGLSGQANVLGFDMAVCIPVGAALYFAARSILQRGLIAVLTGACLAGLLLSLSRSAFVAGAIMYSLWFYRSGRLDSIKYLIPGVVVLAGLFLLAPQSVERRIETIVNPQQRAQDASIQSRFEQFEFAVEAFASSPLVGIGVLRFVPWARAQPGGALMYQDIHNAYLWIATDQGLLGLLPYVAILALTWRDYGRCLRSARARRRLRDPSLTEIGHYATFLQIALLGAMVGGAFSMQHLSKTMWLLLALSPVLAELGRKRVSELGAERLDRPSPASIRPLPTTPPAYSAPATN